MELNGKPVSEEMYELSARIVAIEAGMWVRCVGDRDAYYVDRLTSEGIVIWWHQYSGPGADMWECDHNQDDDETYEPCDPPDNAQELYDLLGIEDDPPAL